jgi:AraC family transcriptional activator of pobA
MDQRQLIIDKEIRDSFRISRLADKDFQQSQPISVVYNRIFIINEGKGVLQVDSRELPIGGHEVFLVSKGQTFSFINVRNTSGIEILFGNCFWERTPASASNCKAILFNNAAVNQRLPLNENSFAAISPIIDMLLSEYKAADYPNKLDAMAAYLKIIMIKLANINVEAGQQLNTADNLLYQKFLELVSSRYSESHEVADFAIELSITSRKLSDICKKKSGHGAKEIINGQLVAEAKRSLQFSSKPVKEIAYDLSFSTPERFTHFFKLNTGVSPVEYRSLFVNIGR